MNSEMGCMQNLIDLIAISYPFGVEKEALYARLLIYAVLTTVLTILLIAFFIKSKWETEKNGFKDPSLNYYLVTIIGIFLMTVNLMLSSISLFLTNGAVMVFGYQKSLFYLLGNLLMFFGLVKISLSVISFTRKGRARFLTLFYLTQIVGIVGFIFVLGNMFQIMRDVKIASIVQGFGILFFLILMISAINVFKEFENDPSKIEVLRMNFLLFGILVQIGQLIARVLILQFQQDRITANILNFYVSPLIDLAGYPLTVIFLYWSIFTPKWLFVKSGVVPKNYEALLG